MKIKSFRMVRIRCFEDTNAIDLSPSCNIFIGQNNAGKSTLLKGLLAFQGFPFSLSDIRPGSHSSYHQIVLTNVLPSELVRNRPNPNAAEFRMVNMLHGAHPPSDNLPTSILSNNVVVFDAARPNHTIIPFLAKRKAPEFTHDITAGSQSKVLGTYSNLYSRVDLLATAGHPRHEQFQKAIGEIVGLPITTKASANGKEAGFYLDDDTFVSLDRMGDGVTDMVALIVELCLERDKVFILEEPETNLHPNGLKALLSMVRASTAQNQFVISTHSNIVVRELGSDEGTKLFRVWRDDEDHKAPSSLEEIPRTPSAHIAMLRELGYGFGDFGLHEVGFSLKNLPLNQ